MASPAPAPDSVLSAQQPAPETASRFAVVVTRPAPEGRSLGRGVVLLDAVPPLPRPLGDLAVRLAAHSRVCHGLISAFRSLVTTGSATAWTFDTTNAAVMDIVQRFASMQAVLITDAKQQGPRRNAVPRYVDASARLFENCQWFEHAAARLVAPYAERVLVGAKLTVDGAPWEVDVLGIDADKKLLLVEAKSGRWDGRDLKKLADRATRVGGRAALVSAQAADAEATQYLAERFGVAVATVTPDGLNWVSGDLGPKLHAAEAAPPAPPVDAVAQDGQAGEQDSDAGDRHEGDAALPPW